MLSWVFHGFSIGIFWRFLLHFHRFSIGFNRCCLPFSVTFSLVFHAFFLWWGSYDQSGERKHVDSTGQLRPRPVGRNKRLLRDTHVLHVLHVHRMTV